MGLSQVLARRVPFYNMLADLCRWHHDIKPNNILLALSSTKNEWQFKMADPGCAQFLATDQVTFVEGSSDKKLPVLHGSMVGSKQFGRSVSRCFALILF